MLKLDSLHKSFKSKQVLKDISFEFESGKIYVIIGESGSGKSTLINCICGIEPISSGKISFNDKVLDNGKKLIKPGKRGIGVSFQNYALFPNMTVKQNIDFVKSDSTHVNTNSLIDKLGIASLSDRKPHELSGGQQQRVAIARSISMNPKIVLLDEPFSSLDESVKHKVRTEIYGILRDQKPLSIIISHDPNDALNYADFVLVIKEGELLQSGTPQEVYNSPKNHYVAQLFGRINDINGQLIRPERIEITPGNDFTVVKKMFNGDSFLYELEDKKSDSILASSHKEYEVGDHVNTNW